MAKEELEATILHLAALAAREGLLAEDIAPQVTVSRPTVHRALRDLVAAGRLIRLGAGRATRYQLPPKAQSDPLGSRKPVGYQRSFLDDYRPNESHLKKREPKHGY